MGFESGFKNVEGVDYHMPSEAELVLSTMLETSFEC